MREIIAGLLVIAFVGAFLRFQGIGYDLPNAYNPDDVYTVEKAIAVADGAFSRGTSIHSMLHAFIYASAFHIVRTINPSVFQSPDAFQDAYTDDRSPFFVIARAVNAFASTATIIAVFLLGRTLIRDAVGLLSALVFSVNVLEVQYAHELYAETIEMFMASATLLTLSYAWKKRSASRLVYAVLLIAVTSLQKIFGVLLLFVYTPICLLIIKHRIGSARTRIRYYIIIIGAIGVAAYLAYPLMLAEVDWLAANKWLGAAPYDDPLTILPMEYRGRFLALLTRLADSVGLVPFTLSVVGMLVSMRKKIVFLIVVSLFIPIYLLFTATMLPDWDTNLLILMPVVSLLSGFGMYVGVTFLKSHLRMSIMAYLFMGTFVLPGLVKSYWFSASYTVLDTRTLEYLWMKERSIDPNFVARDGFTAVTIPPPETLTSVLPDDDLALFDYVVLSSWYSKHFLVPWRNTPEFAARYEEIQNRYEKVAEFAPTGVDPFIDDIKLLTDPGSWPRLRYVRGPLIRVYKRPPTALQTN